MPKGGAKIKSGSGMNSKGNSKMGAEFGRGTQSMTGKPHTSLFESDAPTNVPGNESGKPAIQDKTS
jgi:hypothetical protein